MIENEFRCLKRLFRLALFLICLAGPLIGVPDVRAQAPPALPPGPGKDLVSSACSLCHGLNAITNLRDGAAGWKATTQMMIMRGAPLTLEEGEIVTQYLTKNFGPGAGLMASGPSSAISLPDGSGKELIASRCVLCHDLTRVAGVGRSKDGWDRVVRNMVARSIPATSDQIETMVSYLSARFGEKSE